MKETRATASIADYWDDFYAGLDSRRLASPSPFARWVDDQLGPDHAVVEVGCGNGRDALYFASRGRRVVALDQSHQGIALANAAAQQRGISNLVAQVLAVEALASGSGTEDLRRLLEGATASVYARFFLHAITDDQQAGFLGWAKAFLRSGECCYLEYRAQDLDADEYVFGDHYRRPILPSDIAAYCRDLGFEVVSSEQSFDFAPYGEERPLVGRTVLRQTRG